MPVVKPATEATTSTIEGPRAYGRYPVRLRRAESKHSEDEVPRSKPAVLLARKASLSRPISPINSPALFALSSSDLTRNSSVSRGTSRGFLIILQVITIRQRLSRAKRQVWGRGGSDGTRTRGLRRDRPAF